MSTPGFENLPEVIPIFPLPGVLLLPFGKLPLNIFEPRYLAMTRDALAGDWMIGMVQPRAAGAREDNPEVYPIGCAGRLTALSETEDGRYLITLTGLSRFEIKDELPPRKGYRRTAVDWSRFGRDLHAEDPKQVDRDRLLGALRSYLEAHGITVDWKAIEKASNDHLVTALAMLCPFAPEEKQALLESPGLAERAELMISLFAMAVLDRADPGTTRH